MNVLMLNYEFPPIGGGAAKANLCLLREYAGMPDLRIDVLTSWHRRGLKVQQFAGNITVLKVGVKKKSLHYWRKVEVLEWLLRARAQYRRLLQENRYDLVHAFFGFPTGWLCYRTADTLPYIISLRGSDVPGYNERLGLDYKLLSGLFRRIWRHASAVVANSKGLRDLAGRFMPRLDIGVIYNGIELAQFHPRDGAACHDPVEALTVCRLIRRKRIDLLIRAVRCARDLGVNVRLNVAGDGNLLGALRQLANELGIGKEVRFIGRVAAARMPQVYRDNDIFLMSSQHEGMSNAMLEAMASGLPIVTTHCEGVDELVADNGVVVEPPTPEALARGVAAVLESPQAYQRFSAAARARAEQFTWHSAAEQYLDYYRRAIEMHRKGEG